MKKNLPLFVIIIVVIVLVAIACFLILNNPKESINNNPSSNSFNSNDIIVKDNSETNETNKSFAITNLDVKIDNPSKYTEEFAKSTIKSTDFSDKSINESTYKNINTISVDFSNDLNNNYKTYNGENLSNIEYKSDREKVFSEDTVILPAEIYLLDDSASAYYNYNGELYYIPIIKCNSEDEERIVYQQYDLTVYKKNGKIEAFGKDLNIKYDSDEYDFAGLFNSLFIRNPEASDSQINMYRTLLDDTSLLLTLVSNSGLNERFLCRTFVILNSDGTVQLYAVPSDFGQNVDGYLNLFYKRNSIRNINVSGEIIDNNSSVEFYLFDNGFKVISAE